jgi:hypothetical protein
MHPYGIDTDERRNVMIVLIPLSYWLAQLTRWAFESRNASIPDGLDWIIDPASAAGWYAVLYALVKKRAWRWRWLHRLGIMQTPDLRGLWNGHLSSSWDNFGSTKDIEVTIRQDWTNLVVDLKTDQSRSSSETASLFLNKRSNPVLTYTYLNEPNPNQVATMESHHGTTLLEFLLAPDQQTAEGRYYSGRGRGNHGEMHVTRAGSSP